jgi:hypothetical protein
MMLRSGSRVARLPPVCRQVARKTTVPGKDGRWPELRLPGIRFGGYASGVNDRQFLFVIFALSALSVVLLGIALFSN